MCGNKKAFKYIETKSPEEINESLSVFDKAFLAINPSKVNVGKFRRDLSKYFIENAQTSFSLDEDELVESFSDLTIQ